MDNRDESIGKTVLHVAAMEGWPEAVRLLLAHRGSVTVNREKSTRGWGACQNVPFSFGERAAASFSPSAGIC